MKHLCRLSLLLFLSVFSCFPASSQDVETSGIHWETSVINLGPVLEENGPAQATFQFVNKTNQRLVLEEITTECGCTTAEFSRDTLGQDDAGKVVVQFDPQTKGGEFSKLILVKTNLFPYHDTLRLEGYNVPLPLSLADHYAVKHSDLGFKLNAVNLGQVFTNERQVKYVDFFNFGDYPIQLNQQQETLPSHIEAKLIPAVVTANTRGVLELIYDAAAKNDLGFFEENIELSLLSDERRVLPVWVLSTVHEYFEPVPFSEKDNVPRLAVNEMTVDLSRINSNQVVSRQLTLENTGGQPLHIRKMVANCDCVALTVPRDEIQPGEQMDVTVTFDPSGRRGIDHKTVTIFSNDPLWPTRTVLIKSRIN